MRTKCCSCYTTHLGVYKTYILILNFEMSAEEQAMTLASWNTGKLGNKASLLTRLAGFNYVASPICVRSRFNVVNYMQLCNVQCNKINENKLMFTASIV